MSREARNGSGQRVSDGSFFNDQRFQDFRREKGLMTRTDGLETGTGRLKKASAAKYGKEGESQLITHLP